MTTHPFHRRHAGHQVRAVAVTGRNGNRRMLHVCRDCKRAFGEPHIPTSNTSLAHPTNTRLPKTPAPRKAGVARRAAVPTAGMFMVTTKRRAR